MARAVDEAVAQALDAVSGLTRGDGATQGANLFIGPERPPTSIVPHAAVFCRAYGGPAPVPTMGSTNPSWFRSRVQVLIRSEPDSVTGAFTTAQTRARAIMDALTLPALSGAFATYLRCQVLDSHPTYLGQDSTDHHRFTVNAELWYEE